MCAGETINGAEGLAEQCGEWIKQRAKDWPERGKESIKQRAQ
jgi:hypothetical protein